MKIIVDTPETRPQTATINYAAPRAVNIGDVFYRVERGESVHFREPCRVCGDKRELTVNGVTFRCPCCDKEKTTISVAAYFVRRYRVNEIKESALDNYWKLGDRYVHFHFYRKVGGGACLWGWRDSGAFSMRSDDFARAYNAPYNEARDECDGIYDDYKVALSIAEQMTTRELKRLQEYNEKFGTAHIADFKGEHDPKSN
jgi:hypothetical protein